MKKILFLILLLVSAELVHAQCTNIPVTAETNFATAGIQDFAYSIGGTGSKILVQPDGKYLVAGYVNNLTGSNENVFIGRFHENGTPDASFGSNGRLIYDYLNQNDRIYDMALASDNKIVLAGYTQGMADKNGLVVRLNANGTLDQTFGAGGFVALDAGFNYNEEFTSIALDAANGIFVGGHITIGSYKNLFVAKLTTSGTLNTGFGTSGVWSTNLSPSGDDMVNDLQFDPAAGALYLGGSYYNTSSTSFDSFVLAINASATAFVTVFNGNGQFYRDFSTGTHDGINALQLLSDGKLLFTGYTTSATSSEGKELLAGRINTNGTLDASFGTSGLSPRFAHVNNDEGKCIALQTDGKILLGGYHLNMSNGFVVRLLADGTHDASFGTAGDGSYSSSDFTLFNSLLVSSNGRLLGTGIAGNSKLLVKSHRIRCMPSITYTGLNLEYGDEAVAHPASSNSTGALSYSLKSGATVVTIDAPSGTLSTKAAGTAQVKVSQEPTTSYYGDSVFATIEVSKVELTVTPQSASKVYGETEPTIELLYSGFRFADNESAITTAPLATASSTASTAAGAHTIYVSGGSADNYTFNTSTTAVLTITKKELVVTADNLSKTQGEVNPALTYTIGGFVNDEDETDLSGFLELTTTADENSEPGDYPITVDLSTISSLNYSFSKVDGLLTVSIPTGVFSPEPTYTLLLNPNPAADGRFRIKGIQDLSEVQLINTLGQHEVFYSEDIYTSLSGVLTVVVRAKDKTYVGKVVVP